MHSSRLRRSSPEPRTRATSLTPALVFAALALVGARPALGQEGDPADDSLGDPQTAGEEEDVEDDLLDDELDAFLDDELDALLSGEELPTEVGEEPGVLRGWRGFVELKPRFYLNGRGGEKNDEQLLFETEFELDFRFREDLSAYLRPNVLVDLVDTELFRWVPLEAYMTYERDTWDLRGGLLVENWGIVDTYNPLDVLNRRDVRAEILDGERLGELGVRYRHLFTGGETFGEPTVSLYAIPLFQPTPFPPEDQRFGFGGNGVPFDEDAAFEPTGAEQGFYAVRGQSTLSTAPLNADLSVVAARGPSRNLNLELDPTLLRPVYYGAETVGVGIRAVPNEDVLGGQAALLTLKAEMAYNNPYNFDGAPTETPKEYFSYVVGVDRSFDRLFSDIDSLTFTVEYAGEAGGDDFPSLFRPFRDDLILRGFWRANDFARQSLEVRSIFDLEVDEQIYEALYERQVRSLHEDLRFILHLQVIDPAEPGESFFSFFPDTTSLAFGLRFDF